ncbi:MAG: Fic family protein [Kiritimatiellales bacterium]
MNSVPEKLTRICAAGGFTQEALAARLGVSFVTLNKWVNGRAVPRQKSQEKIDLLFADILGSDSVDAASVTNAKLLALTKQFTIGRLLANREILDRITVNLTYHSNATEGSTMTEADVAAVLFDSRILKNRTAIEQCEAINHRSALNFLLDALQTGGTAFMFTPDLLRATHLRLMNGVISNAGEYRNHGARIHGAFVPLANFIKIPELINLWCEQMNAQSGDPVNLLAATHAEFERIHPFSDGNGRTGRLFLFIKALQLGLVPPVIHKERRNAYYKYLKICQTRGNPALLEKFIAEAILETAGKLAPPEEVPQ